MLSEPHRPWASLLKGESRIKPTAVRRAADAEQSRINQV